MNEMPQSLWEQCLTIFKNNVNERQYETWLKPIKFKSYDAQAKELKVNVPSQYFYEFLEEHFRRLLLFVIYKIFGEGTQLIYEVEVAIGNGIADQASNTSSLKIQNRPREGANQSPTILQTVGDLDSQLNTNQNFENFIEGISNKLPRTVGQAIAENPTNQTFNPLFVYGPSGVGKTHLVNAIGIKLKELHPELRVLYLSAHLFQVQFQDATRNNRTPDFMHFYQSIDVLIIDDIQELIGKERTQYAFFHIFNHLRQVGKQIILTSDRPPIMLQGMEERLITRFKCGLLAELERPEMELRKNILHNKIKKDGLRIPNDVVNYISENVSESVRELEGVINSLLAYSVVFNREVDLDFAQRIMNHSAHTVKKEITLDQIIESTCEQMNIKEEDIYGKSRKANIVLARQLSMYLAQEFTQLTTSKIGILVGNRNHATVIHSVKTISNRLKTDKELRKCVDELENKLKNKQ